MPLLLQGRDTEETLVTCRSSTRLTRCLAIFWSSLSARGQHSQCSG